MKPFITCALFLIAGISFGQVNKNKAASLKIINQIFTAYIKQAENIDAEENKIAMTKAISTLQLSGAQPELTLFINVWMYYDPTDYPTRSFIEPVF